MEEAVAKAAIAGNSSTAEEEEEGGGEAEATIVCPAVLIRPKIRDGLMEAAGMGILITAAHLAAHRPACIIMEGGMEVSRVEGA